MAKIFSLNSRNEITHEILIDDSCILRDDSDCISFRIHNMSWSNHAQKCPDCNALINSFGKQTYKWLLEDGNMIYLLDTFEFGDRNDHFSNLNRFEISKDYYGSELRFKRKIADPVLLEAIKVIRTDEEEYENCSELVNAINYITGNNKG